MTAPVDGQTLTAEALGILHHALGVSDPYQCDQPPYRNHFVAGQGHDDEPLLLQLVQQGLMVVRESKLTGGDALYVVSDRGVDIALKSRPRVPQKKLLYRRFLSVRDCCPDLTFREFLTSPEFAECRG